MHSLTDAITSLREHFGFDNFREGQREVIESILAGKDVVVVMPTGSGKSLCYQLPALILDGVTVVVSPLIALMKDQVDALRARGLPATFVNSSIPESEQRARIESLRRREHKLIYVAPERFRSSRFNAALQSIPISLFAVDEAHCISTWGHDFRPDYLRLRHVIHSLGNIRTLALTATATPYVRSDIIQQLGLVRAQDDFMSGRTQMIVATNAFGMGIDKRDIRFVAHYQIPGSIEAYYQEIGRAGRDGLPSTCMLLFNYADKNTHDFFIEGSYPPPEVIAKVYEALV